MNMPLLFILCCSANNTDLGSSTEGLNKPEMRSIIAQKAREEFKTLKNKEDKSDLKNDMYLPCFLL